MPPYDPEARPKLRSGVTLAPADAGRWQARWDFDEVTFLEGEACQRVLPWLASELNGLRSVRQLESLAAQRGAVEQLKDVLVCLKEQGLLTLETAASGRSEEDPALREAVEALACGEAGEILGRCRAARVVVCGRSTLANEVWRAIQNQGFTASSLIDPISPNDSLPPAGEVCLPVIVESDWDQAVLESINRSSLAARRPWMIVGAWSRRVLVGPIFVPGETACYDCYRKRLDSHRRHLAAFQALERWQRDRNERPEPSPVLPAVARLAAAWTALEVFHYVTRVASPRTLGRVLVYDPAEARLGIETVLKIPWCPTCGDAS
jgi:bacteriocin biosynthesis cyclodehydratase domain-containing protein